jgi:spore germination protein YaaH
VGSKLSHWAGGLRELATLHSGTLHRVDYDDSESLTLKYQYAKSVGARGVGMWTASALDYTGDPAMGQAFWRDLKQFSDV